VDRRPLFVYEFTSKPRKNVRTLLIKRTFFSVFFSRDSNGTTINFIELWSATVSFSTGPRRRRSVPAANRIAVRVGEQFTSNRRNTPNELGDLKQRCASVKSLCMQTVGRVCQIRKRSERTSKIERKRFF